MRRLTRSPSVSLLSTEQRQELIMIDIGHCLYLLLPHKFDNVRYMGKKYPHMYNNAG